MQISSKLSILRWDLGGKEDLLRRSDKIVFNSFMGTEPKRFDTSKETSLQFLGIVTSVKKEVILILTTNKNENFQVIYIYFK